MRCLAVLLLLFGALSARNVFQFRQGQFPSTLFGDFEYDDDDFELEDDDDETVVYPQFKLPHNFPFHNFPPNFPFHNNFPPNFPFHNVPQTFPFGSGFPFQQFQRPGFKVQSFGPFVQTHLFPFKRQEVESPIHETSTTGFLNGFFNNLASSLRPTFSLVTKVTKLVDDILPPAVQEKVGQLLEEKDEAAHAQLKEEIVTEIKERVDEALNVDSRVTVDVVGTGQDKKVEEEPWNVGGLIFGPEEVIVVESPESDETTPGQRLPAPDIESETSASTENSSPSEFSDEAAAPHTEAAEVSVEAAVSPKEAAAPSKDAKADVDPVTAEDLANLRQTPR